MRQLDAATILAATSPLAAPLPVCPPRLPASPHLPCRRGTDSAVRSAAPITAPVLTPAPTAVTAASGGEELWKRLHSCRTAVVPLSGRPAAVVLMTHGRLPSVGPHNSR